MTNDVFANLPSVNLELVLLDANHLALMTHHASGLKASGASRGLSRDFVFFGHLHPVLHWG